MKPWYYGVGCARDLIEWPPGQARASPREEDAWFTEPDAKCSCGAAKPGDWTSGVHHGVHKCARVVTSINGHRRAV